MEKGLAGCWYHLGITHQGWTFVELTCIPDCQTADLDTRTSIGILGKWLSEKNDLRIKGDDLCRIIKHVSNTCSPSSEMAGKESHRNEWRS